MDVRSTFLHQYPKFSALHTRHLLNPSNEVDRFHLPHQSNTFRLLKM